MKQTPPQPLPTMETLREVWGAWQSLIGVTRIVTEEEYDRVVAILNVVLDATRGVPVA